MRSSSLPTPYLSINHRYNPNITATLNLMLFSHNQLQPQQGKQIKAVPLTMVHAPPYLLASSCRITKHLITLHIILHSPECPLSSDLSLMLMMIQAPHISFLSY